ncbi:MAG: rod shape-determining protein MreC [Anaerolineales bacterium]|nr:rod shape-determining protein MreC [Anaerolineales bacterium]
MNTRSPRFLQSITIAVISIGLVILALGGYLTPLSRLVLTPLVTAQTWISNRFLAVQDLVTSPRDITVLTQRNTDLEAEVANLQTQIIELQQQLGEYQILSALLDFARAYPEYQYVGASVIGRDPSPFVKYIHLNRGTDDGLLRGMPVVIQQGLVGRISQTTASAALVQLITDPGMAINIRLEPERVEGIISGSITGDVGLDFIPQEANVKPGDLVLTSGLGGNFPPNILIGQLTSVRSQDFDLFQSASVQTVVDFDQLDIVLVITNFKPLDLSPLIPSENP